MGGMLSGRRPDPARRRVDVEEAEAVTARQHARGESPADLGAVELATDRARYGVRHWFLCPGCGRRCRILHRPPGVPRWACRACHGLGYRSCRAPRHETYRSAVAWLAPFLDGPPEALLAALEAGASPTKRLAFARFMGEVDALMQRDEFRADDRKIRALERAARRGVGRSSSSSGG